jgi:hypothetical protein
MKPTKPARLWETGRSVQVDICPEDVGFVMSIGRVSLWLKLEEAQDLVATLTRALIRSAALTAAEEKTDLGPEAGRSAGGPTELQLTQGLGLSGLGWPSGAAPPAKK